MLKVMILASAINLGDISNAEETFVHLQKALGHAVPHANIDASKSSEEVLAAYQAKQPTSQSDHVMVIAVGDNGLKALGAIQDAITTRPTYVYFSGHQFFKALDPVSLHIDHVMLPEFTVDKGAQKALSSVRLTKTFGVPTKNLSKEALKESYDNWNERLDISKRYLVVMLPGDAPDVDGSIKLFSQKSNKQLFDCIYAWWKQHRDYEILLQTGPRTGKHDAAGKVMCNHEYRTGEEPPIDKISAAFIAQLDSHKVPHKFWNFAFEVTPSGKKITHSVYNPLLHLSSLPGNFYVVPAESVSGITQLTHYLPHEQIIAFAPDSMNSAHRKLLQKAFDLGYLSVFTNTCKVESSPHLAYRAQDDAEIVARDLVEGLRAKFPDIDLSEQNGITISTE